VAGARDTSFQALAEFCEGPVYACIWLVVRLISLLYSSQFHCCLEASSECLLLLTEEVEGKEKENSPESHNKADVIISECFA
jgi:hypothetical protein